MRSPVGLKPGASAKEIFRLRQRPPIILRVDVVREPDCFLLIDKLRPRKHDF